MKVTIIPFSTELTTVFASLNYEWLKKYFVIEPHDTEMLEAPKEYIIDTGGEIFFAEYDSNIVGTVALIKINEGYYEIAKMAVTEAYQGLSIGKLLLNEALVWSKENGVKKLMLESNRKLKPALNLYKKVGFYEIPQDPNSPYDRADIKMELIMDNITL